jgi:hypothetical protein
MVSFFMRVRIGGMGADEAYREAWRKFKASAQAELNSILAELERLHLENPASAIRRLAVSPEDHFGSAGDWESGIIDTGRELSSNANIPQELRLRLQQISSAMPFKGNGELFPSSAH